MEKQEKKVKGKGGKADKGAPVSAPPIDPTYQPELMRHYREVVVPDLMKRFGLVNRLQAPRLDLISVNIGLGHVREVAGAVDNAVTELSVITGQKAVLARARKAISNFKLRLGEPIGARVTLRGWKMYEFLERLIGLALPRVRDFNGLSARSFDGRGNFNFGLREQVVFPEINYDKMDKIRGMNITIATTARNDEMGYELLKGLGFPFRGQIRRKSEQTMEAK